MQLNMCTEAVYLPFKTLSYKVEMPIDKKLMFA